MQNIIDFLFDTKEIMPHDNYFSWNPSLLWLFVIANAVAALSYFSIPAGLGLFAHKRKQIEFKWKLLALGVFIIGGGFILHLLSAVTALNPADRLTGIAEVFAVVVSAATVFLLWLLIPKTLHMPGPFTMFSANKKLEHEILYPKETKTELNRLNSALNRSAKLRARELPASELRFSTLFEEAPLGIAVINSMTGHFHDVNPRFAEIVGRSKEEIMNSNWMHITHPDDIQEEMDKLSLLNDGTISVFKITKRYIRPDNAIVWVRLSSAPVKPALFHLHIIEDITETQLAEQRNRQEGKVLEQPTTTKKPEDEIVYPKETKAQLNRLNSALNRSAKLRARELPASELRFSTLFEEAPLGIAVINSMTGHFHDVNPRFAEIVGRSKEEIMDSNWMHITHPDDIQEEMDKLSLLNDGTISVFKITKRYIRPDNAIVWVRLSSVPVKPALFHLHIIEDITETRLAEQRNRQLGNILEQSINEIYIINSETLFFEHANQGGINNLGFSLDELKNMSLLDIKPEFDIVLFTDLIRLLINGEQSQLRFETIHQRKNGTRYPVETCLQIYRDNPDYLVAICLDISQRKAIERNLVNERNLLLNLINNIPDYIYYKNTAGEYVVCNKAVADYFNQPVENITGHTNFDFVDPETAISLGEHDAAVLIQGGTLVNEEAITLPGGKQVLLETLKTPVIDSDGNLLGLIGIGRDITERKAHEEKISRLSNFYANLSKINHAIVQINNEEELFATVCTIAANLQQIKLAWIGRPDASSQRIVPLAAGGEIKAYLADLVVSVDPDVPEGQGPAGLAYRESRIVAVNDFQADPSTGPWHDNAEKCFAWGSACSVPILQNQTPYAVLNVYSDEKNFFDEEALKLMAELSLDLSFALDSYAHEAARRIAEDKLELAAKVFNQSGEGITITDKNNNIISVNPGFTAITGYEEHEVLGKNPKILASGRQDKEFYRVLWESLLKNNIWQGEIWNRHKNGTVYPEWLTLSVVRDETGDIVNYIAIFTDITQYKAAEKQIEHLAHYDSLTDLPNRLLLKSRVDYQLIVADRHKKTFALLFVDLDHFKNINDSLGHSIGDQVLIEVGRRLLACVREEDTVARLGGDEFIILLADSNENGAAIAAGKIIALLTEPILYQNHQLYITPSIGISLYPDNGDSYETLSKNADTALYQAKKHGRNQYQFFTPAMQQQTQRRMEIESDLRHAIARNELMVYFQPQVNAQTGQIIGAEALLRWQHPVWGMVSPAEFIPVAEECGLIIAIGDWVLEQSIAQARQWHDTGFPLTIAVNLSLAQFRSNTLFEKVKQTLEYFHLFPQYLELELTESIAMQNAELAIETTRRLTHLGIKLSIDDFGTGYSSLNYLQRFSLHKLKIDQSFTRSMVGNKDSENIVDAVISLAKSLNLKTIAEGVETRQQLDMFKLKLCDEIQGYYFSKPVPADEFMTLMKTRFMV